jgi:hypothetical protein
MVIDYMIPRIHLQLTGLDNGRALAVLDSTAAGASGLKSLDNIQRLLVGNLAEDDVLAIQPRSDDGGDEELRAVGVGTSIGHGQQTRLGVLQVEVLILELLAVDGLTTGAVAAGEVTSLKHEVGDDTVERRALVTKALLTSAESTEVLGGVGNLVVKQVEVDAASLGLDSRGRLAALKDGALPLNIEVSLDTHFVGSS